MTHERAEVPLHDPQAGLESALIDDFLRRHGYDPGTLHALPDDQMRTILTAASRFAAEKLAEVRARATYVHDIHGLKAR
jgi:hypothetical protein